MSDFSFVLPDGFADIEWEVESKGCFFGAKIVVSGNSYCLNFYDAVRLSQEIEDEFERRGIFFESNLVIIKSVTAKNMEIAADHLVKSGLLCSLVPEVLS